MNGNNSPVFKFKTVLGKSESFLSLLNDGHTETVSPEAIHPIELTVQSLTESPLELLNLNMQSLYESQIILSGMLLKMQKKLDGLGSSVRSGEEVDSEGLDDQNTVEAYKKRINVLAEKLKKINAVLAKVEARVDRIAAGMRLD
ncbi:unnamed protein product [Kuraishia capsulata CBS 1993]|uniref:Uncharacterized protein n=1 Tax=Kuraishia capsulata CBS 1993 TaxID=1382522 RepID=W6MX40_9ASCO|nr:uncharacterized protein KUCA_T00004207001 [Kuraishia capsulata CBS 1993]CDK28225.1 unnamed protein product [Kuraishia capsulata CBS 1993]